MLSLQLDVGNTATKWRLMDRGRRVNGGRCSLDAESLDRLASLSPDELWVASVASDQVEAQLCRDFQRHGLKPEFVRAANECAGVRNSYAEPGKMGVDRWLAMLGAYRAHPGGVVVVDAGTAATIDLVAPDGRHIGGYILPGFRLMCSSLTGSTGRVRYDNAAEVSLRPGRQTADCVEGAAWLALVSAVSGAIEQYTVAEGVVPDVVLTGGDAQVIAGLAGSRAAGWSIVEELVLDGLQLAVQAKGSGER